MFGTLVLFLCFAVLALLLKLPWLATIFSIAAIVYVLGCVLRKGASASKAVAKKSAGKIKGELKKVAEAQTSYPQAVIAETLKETGRKAGEATFDEYGVWSSGETSKAFRAKLGKSTKNFINKFLSLFK
ncbi:MAG: hypothetical protein DRO07_02365 [Candidatus Iainarchaeum archaeon]|uniref:Uncharacterized protein n=1 Tax=Candidatus Iainarchaeum sp. TaxID=3101447 RepID=A0A497JF99_9ARCH|nr:MAG: hypothetical protein DRO07_02365 [Candidatus Diapherotrites archaeon]